MKNEINRSETIEEGLRRAEKVYFILEYRPKEVIHEALKLDYDEVLPCLRNVADYRDDLEDFINRTDKAYNTLVALGLIKEN